MLKKEGFMLRAVKKVFHIPTRFPYFIQLDVTSFCNLNCVMCPRQHVNQKLTSIDFEKFKKIINRLQSAEEISLTGLGESLIYPHIYDAIKYCKSKGIIVKITTNGLLLDTDEKTKELILSRLDSISFSLEGIDDENSDGKAHKNSNKAVENIERLIRLKKELNSATPKVSIQSVLIKDRENDIYKIIKWANTHDIDRVNVLRMTKYFETGLKRPNMKEEKRIFKELARLRKEYKVRIDCLQDQFYTGWKGFLYKHLKHFLGLDTYCVRLFDYPYITQEGDMIPCCVLNNYKFGNILQEEVKNVWLGNKFNHFRKNHNNIEICAKCDNLRIKQIV